MSNLPADAVVPPPSNADPQRAKRDAARTTGDHLFWLARIDDALPRITLVPDYKRSAARHVYGEVAFALDAEALRAMRGVDRPRGVSDVALCATLVTIALAQYHRDDEGVVGIAAPGPAGSLAVAPMRVDCDRARTIAETMRGIASEAATVLERLPSGALDSARILGDAARSGASALFNVAIVAGGDAAFDFASYPVDLAFRFDEASGMARGSISFAEDLYERASIEGLAAHVEAACRAVAARPDALLGDIDVLSPSERTQILRDFATRTARYPTERTLHALFEEQVAKTPDALAAIDAGGTLTYRELEARANRLAHLLLDLGITKGAFVGIFLPRGCGFLTAMLAVFKAGGAYVPLDPSYPAERLRYMLDDSEARVVVSRRALIESMRDGGKDGRRVFVSLDAYAAPPAGVVGAPDRLAALPDAAPRLPLAGGDRAYMIYTSGSTGRAKGAICRHAGAINHLFGELDGMGIGGPFRFMQSAASS